MDSSSIGITNAWNVVVTSHTNEWWVWPVLSGKPLQDGALAGEPWPLGPATVIISGYDDVVDKSLHGSRKFVLDKDWASLAQTLTNLGGFPAPDWLSKGSSRPWKSTLRTDPGWPELTWRDFLTLRLQKRTENRWKLNNNVTTTQLGRSPDSGWRRVTSSSEDFRQNLGLKFHPCPEEPSRAVDQHNTKLSKEDEAFSFGAAAAGRLLKSQTGPHSVTKSFKTKMPKD